MPTIKQKISPFLWFDTQAEEAARFYVSVFDRSRIVKISRYGAAGREVHGKEAGTVLTVEFEIEGQMFTALNGGPQFKFNESVSFVIACETQAEIDYFWDKLTEGGAESACGWLKDRFGLSWQVVPAALPHMLAGADSAASERVMAVVMRTRKFDIAALERAYAGQA